MSSEKNPKQTEHDRLSFDEFLKVFKWVVTIQVSVHKGLAVLYALVRTTEVLLPLGFAFVTSLLLDTVLEVVQTQGSLQGVYPYLAIMFGLNLFESVLNSLRWYSYRQLHNRTDASVKQMIYQKLVSLGIQQLEDPDITNNISRINNSAFNITDYYRQAVQVFGQLVGFIVALVLMAIKFPILAPLLLISALPAILMDKKYRAIAWSFGYSNTEKRRRAWANAWDLGQPTVLQEVITIDGMEMMDKKFMDFVMWEIEKRKEILKSWFIRSDLLGLIHSVAYYYGYSQILLRLVIGKLTVGGVLFNIRLLDRLVQSFNEFTGSLNNMFESSIRFKDSYILFQKEPAFADGKVVLPPLPQGPKIDINNITFTYPRTTKPVLENFSLLVESGEKIAIVGHNGAGKTTLAKLIARMYMPDSGDILINKYSLKDIKCSSLYNNTSILFQDYNTYGQFSVRENVSIGDTKKKVDDEKVIEALKKADAWDFVQKFDNGLDQVLSERYKGGIRPSTGQWQKIAIARFFYRDAPLIIFDEPTAAIDAVSEYNIFNKIYEFFEGKTVILISHRFSTVRNADRIIVVENGKIIEQGSHDELIDLDGYYAKSFRLQAEGYSMEKTETIA